MNLTVTTVNVSAMFSLVYVSLFAAMTMIWFQSE